MRNRLIRDKFDSNKAVCHVTLTLGHPGDIDATVAGGTVAHGAVAASKVSEDSTIQWLALTLTQGLGATKARRLVELFGGIQGIFRASLTELEAAGLQAVSAQSLGTGHSMELAQEESQKAKESGVTVISLDDPGYPPNLKQIYDPPVVLYVRGSVEILSQPGIALVGTRHPTPYGTGMAEKLAHDLAAKGKTVGVLGTGVDVIYPKDNNRLVDQILSLGETLISEFPLQTFAAPQNFPIRNRIISGISVGVLVVEAAEYSGTRITSRCALEQNREVFAVPGNVTNKNSWGPNTLIKQGAKLVATWEDVWEELPANVRLTLEPTAAHESSAGQAASLFGERELPPHEKKILALLKADEALHIDEIVERLEPGVSSSEIFVALFELELAGKVRRLPGKNFIKVM
jgi:DNA processing protein